MCGFTAINLPEPQVPSLLVTELTTHVKLSLSRPLEYRKSSIIICPPPKRVLREGDKQFASVSMAGVMRLEFTGPRSYVQKTSFVLGKESSLPPD